MGFDFVGAGVPSRTLKSGAGVAPYMVHVTIRAKGVKLDRPFLVEGFPGVGLVGKIAVDHMIDALDMTYYASVDSCEDLPRLATYEAGDYEVRPPIRIYADESQNLLALKSDVPMSRSAAEPVSKCLVNWFADQDVTPLLLSGQPTDEKSTPPELFGVATGDAGEHLDAAGVDRPTERGAVSGPTGALLARASELDMDAVGLVVESNKQFPDPEASRVLIENAISPIADVEVSLAELVEHADEISAAREKLAERMQEVGEEESTQAKPLRMFQ